MAGETGVRGHGQVFAGGAQAFTGARGEEFDDVRAGVVAGVAVLVAGIAQSYDQEVADGRRMLLAPEQGSR